MPNHRIVAFLFSLATCLTACHYFPDHYLVYPRRVPDDVITWSQAIERAQLLVQLEGARPPGDGPFPTVLVHPEGGKTAADMKGIIWDLAGRGYVAIAADYQRCVDGACEPNLFAWRSPSDATTVVDLTKDYAVVDQTRIALLGFSQGGVFSLLIAAYAPDRIRAVVSYYPVTDFVHWLREDRSGWWQRRIYGVIRWYFRRQSGAVDDADFTEMLRRASPYYVADAIQAPVLLVHGERDTTAPVEESMRMAERLRALGKEADLLVIPGAVHIFNFRQQREAASAWKATLEWLDRHLRVASS